VNAIACGDKDDRLDDSTGNRSHRDVKSWVNSTYSSGGGSSAATVLVLLPGLLITTLSWTISFLYDSTLSQPTR